MFSFSQTSPTSPTNLTNLTSQTSQTNLTNPTNLISPTMEPPVEMVETRDVPLSRRWRNGSSRLMMVINTNHIKYSADLTLTLHCRAPVHVHRDGLAGRLLQLRQRDRRGRCHESARSREWRARRMLNMSSLSMYQVSANLTWEAIDTCIMESITVMTEDPVIQQVSPERPRTVTGDH